MPGLARRRGAGRSARARPRRAWCPGGVDSEPDDELRPGGGGRPDGPRPGLVGVLWCVVVILAVLVVGVAIGISNGGG